MMNFYSRISIFAWTIPIIFFSAHPSPSKYNNLDKAYLMSLSERFSALAHLAASPEKWEMRHLSMTTLLSALFLSTGERNKKLFELVSLWHPTPGALEVDALLMPCLSSLQGHSFGLLPQAPDRSGNIHQTFLASLCSFWERLGDTLRYVLKRRFSIYMPWYNSSQIKGWGGVKWLENKSFDINIKM